MDVRNDWNVESFAHLTQDAQRFLVADTRKRIDARTVGFTIRAFENVWYMKLSSDPDDFFMGAPYEPGDVPFTGTPELLGGGFGDYAPGEWSDDTQMSLYIARVAATGADLTSREALDEIARGFCRWVALDGASDVGVQTRRVLGAVVDSRDEPGIAAPL